MNRCCVAWSLAMVVGWGACARGADEPLPEDAARLVAAFEEDAEAIRKEAEERIAVQRAELAAQLKELQDKYCKEAKLDEAVAIRDRIRELKESTVAAQADPGNLTTFVGRPGRLYFKVTGNANGYAWGTDVYTADSLLATVAVHAGALKSGETGIVRVTMLDGRDAYAGSTRNGVTSSAWSNFDGSYEVSRIKDFAPFEPLKARPAPEAPARPEAPAAK